METFFATLATYKTWFISGWLLIAGVTFQTTVAYTLKDADRTLTVYEAIKLTFAGIFCLVPFVRMLVPDKAFVDFMTRWRILGFQMSFQCFTAIFLTLCVVLSPIAFLIVYVAILLDTLNYFRKCSDDVQ
jgi:hypothetical protein